MEVQGKESVNSRGIRPRQSVPREAGIASAEKLTGKVEKGKVNPYPSFRHKTLGERIRESGCELTGIGEINRARPAGNEVW